MEVTVNVKLSLDEKTLEVLTCLLNKVPIEITEQKKQAQPIVKTPKEVIEEEQEETEEPEEETNEEEVVVGAEEVKEEEESELDEEFTSLGGKK